MTAFEACTLPPRAVPASGARAAGVGVSAAGDAGRGDREVLRRIEGVRREIGKAGLYHETVSWAFMLIIQDRIARGQQLTLGGVRRRQPRPAPERTAVAGTLLPARHARLAARARELHLAGSAMSVATRSQRLLTDIPSELHPLEANPARALVGAGDRRLDSRLRGRRRTARGRHRSRSRRPPRFVPAWNTSTSSNRDASERPSIAWPVSARSG